MSKLSKVIVTIIVIIVFIILTVVVHIVREEAGYRTPGIMGLIVFGAMVGALSAVWRKRKDDKGDDITNRNS
ncbi:MAG TPA: hypothetical protein IAC47_05280 [Candidatus Onthomorpha intestinigallinarum]|uniref:Uncharacterized protein n=1 Tax=Candidatus Onthomorpha intestinigallinarum TaxID=2840880 RepID=A0A9D1RIF3_9BACT|nr:hypothetical protein [Candidatus Onthomorpha intestinigallinarum]